MYWMLLVCLNPYIWTLFDFEYRIRRHSWVCYLASRSRRKFDLGHRTLLPIIKKKTKLGLYWTPPRRLFPSGTPPRIRFVLLNIVAMSSQNDRRIASGLIQTIDFVGGGDSPLTRVKGVQKNYLLFISRHHREKGGILRKLKSHYTCESSHFSKKPFAKSHRTVRSPSYFFFSSTFDDSIKKNFPTPSTNRNIDKQPPL